MKFTIPAALAALAAMACCIPLGLAGAVGVLSLGEMFTTLQPWFLGLAGVLLAVGAVQCFRGRRTCKRSASAFSLLVLGLSASVVVGILAFPQHVAGWIADYALGPMVARDGSGQPALADLNLDAFKTQFNEAAGSTRVILLISPSCPYCLRGAADFERVLQRHAQVPLAVFAVWQPILPTDWGRPGTLPLRRLNDMRVRHYWDPDHRVARVLNDAGEVECCYEEGVPWDSIAVFEPGSVWGDSVPKPVLFDGIIMDVVERFEGILAGLERNEPTGSETRVR